MLIVEGFIIPAANFQPSTINYEFIAEPLHFIFRW